MNNLDVLSLDAPMAAVGRWLGWIADAPTALLVALVLVGGALAWWQVDRSGHGARTNVIVRRTFSSPEGELWRRIQRAMPDHVVLMGVPLTRFMMVRKAGGLGRNERRLAELSVDFAVFRADGTISSVVLMTDTEAVLPRRQQRLRQKLLERARIRQVRWSSLNPPSVEVIAGALDPDLIALVASEPSSGRRQFGMAIAR